MTVTFLFLVVGLLLIGVALLSPALQRLPVSTSTLYLGIGFLLGPAVVGLLDVEIIRDATLFERLTEIAVLVSLFTVGLNMRRSLRDRLWLLPVRLASLTMLLTIAAVTLVGTLVLGLPLGAAVLLGAILAPTDPVLASDVQLQDPTDQDVLRYGLSGEAGLNDGSAFPLVILGLGLLGLQPQSESGLINPWAGAEAFSIWRWLGWDVLWAVVVGLVVGAGTGWLVGQGTLLLQRRRQIAFSLHEFLALGLIALAYSLTELVYGYGFLAVFAAGYALRYIELRRSNHAETPVDLPAVAPGDTSATEQMATTDPEQAAQFLAVSLMDFNDKLEHILEAAVVVLVGATLATIAWDPAVVWLAPLLFLLVRPLSVFIGLLGGEKLVGPVQRRMISWFGIRGIGSIYYLTYAIEHGLAEPLAQQLTSIVLALVAISIVVHGISVTPLMARYNRLAEQRVEQGSGA